MALLTSRFLTRNQLISADSKHFRGAYYVPDPVLNSMRPTVALMISSVFSNWMKTKGGGKGRGKNRTKEKGIIASGGRKWGGTQSYARTATQELASAVLCRLAICAYARMCTHVHAHVHTHVHAPLLSSGLRGKFQFLKHARLSVTSRSLKSLLPLHGTHSPTTCSPKQLPITLQALAHHWADLIDTLDSIGCSWWELL